MLMIKTRPVHGAAGALMLAIAIQPGGLLAQEQELFDSPDAAISALLDALAREDDAGVLAILGAEHEDQIFGEDHDLGREERARFVLAARRYLDLRPDGESRRIAYVGARAWPLPIPIVRQAGGWRFDTEDGIQELID
jgi:Protein of unknown function (DUF2950)